MNASPSKLRLKIMSDPANLAPVRQAVEKLCADNRMEQSACEDVGLCVNEAMANIIRHAYRGATDKPIEVSAEVDPGGIQVAIRDWGNGVNPQELPEQPHNPLEPGGLGMMCLRQMLDDVVFAPQPDGMLLVMTRKKKRNA